MSIVDRMYYRALDANFNVISIMDFFDSMIWTDSYDDVGDFEVHGPNSPEMQNLAYNASYIFNTITSGLMIVERPKAAYDEEDGDTITVSGNSFKSFLNRRVLQRTTTILNPADRRISQIICNFVSDAFGPTDPKRYWNKLVVVNATSANSVKLPVNVGIQFDIGTNLLDLVKNLCGSFGLGFRCELSLTDGKIHFIVYEGVNRSVGANQVMFSDLYDNLITATEELNSQNMKNAALVVGSATDPVTKLPKLPQMISNDAFTGLNRREMYFRASQSDSINNGDGTQTPMSDADYIAAIVQAGSAELNKAAYKLLRNYEGEIVEGSSYSYGTNYYLGDIVAFWMPHSKSVKARLVSITFSEDGDNGKTIAPKFDYDV